MIKYAIPIIFLTCMTAYEASAANATLNCGGRFEPQKSFNKAPKKPHITKKQFSRLLAHFNITAYKQFIGSPKDALKKQAEKWWGDEVEVPGDPLRVYGWKWTEIVDRPPPEINWISQKKLAELLQKLNIPTHKKFRSVPIEDLNKKAEDMFGKGVRVPADPIQVYGENWQNLVSGESRAEQQELAYQESLTLDLPGFIEKYLSKTFINELRLTNREIEQLFHNFQQGMKLLNEKDFRRALQALSSADARAGNSKLKQIIKDTEFAFKKHAKELKKSSGHKGNKAA